MICTGSFTWFSNDLEIGSILKKDHGDASVGKGVATEAWQPQFHLQNSHKQVGENQLQSCPQTSTPLAWHALPRMLPVSLYIQHPQFREEKKKACRTVAVLVFKLKNYRTFKHRLLNQQVEAVTGDSCQQTEDSTLFVQAIKRTMEGWSTLFLTGKFKV